MAEPEDIVDISGLRPAKGEGGGRPRGGAQRGESERPWLAMKWKCCRAYSRVYRNRAGDAYEGRCPKCGKAVRVPIGPGGTSERFFEAG